MRFTNYNQSNFFNNININNSSMLSIDQLNIARTIADRNGIPEGFREVSAHQVIVDKNLAILLRYAPIDQHPSLGGEHASFIIGSNGVLKGFTRMVADYGVAENLPDKATAQSIALDFLTKTAPELLAHMSILWIARHDETVSISDEKNIQQKHIVSGIKIKALDQATGLYFWAIVGCGENIVTFERDIHWITFPGRRKTERWLHDTWLNANSDKCIRFS